MKAKNKSRKSQTRLHKQVAECIKLLDKARATFGADAPALTPAERLRLPKPRPNVANVVSTVAALVQEHGLVLPKHSVDDMKANLETVQTLAPLHAKAALVLKMIEDALLLANGGTWASATAFYTVLRRIEGADGNLAAQLEPLAQTFAKKTSKKKAATPPSDSSTSPAPEKPAADGASSMVG